MIKIIRIFLLIAIISSHAFAGENLSLCTDGLTAPNPYVIEQGELISANSDIYLESNGTQYINTEIIPTQNTRIVASISVTGAGQSSFNWMFGVINRQTLGKESCYGLAINSRTYYSEIAGNNKNYGPKMLYLEKKEFDFTVTDLVTPENTYKTGATTLAQTETQMYLFANHGGGGGLYDSAFVGRIYYFKIYENDELIRHFVPVPTGLQIGDFIVPSNGMWDLVEQKFYGNIGKGEFTYGGPICVPCPAHQYYENNACHDCPTNYTDDKTVGKTDISDCKIFCVGGYVANKYDTICTDPGTGYWAPREYISYGQTSIPYKCPDGTTTAGFGAAADESEDCGHILWVNNSPIYLRQSQKIKPSLHVKLNNITYHASATPIDKITDISNLTNKLYLMLNNTQYIVHDDNLYEHHTIKNGELTWVSPDVFLNSNGVPYINTDFIPNANTVIETTIMATGNSSYNWFFGNIDRPNLGKKSCFGLAIHGYNFYTEINGSNDQLTAIQKNTKYPIRFEVSRLYLGEYFAPTGASTATYIPASYPMYLFANNAGGGTTYDQRFIGRIYEFKIYDGDILVRHFVPVPTGLQIGDFIVPANGMWDMVEQKFYGNIGDGDFTYGTDL